MGCLGNVLWFIFGGAVSGLSWCLAGCLWCITIVGIPVGMQCFKFASLSFFPIREGCGIRRRNGFLCGKCGLAPCVRVGAGAGTSFFRSSFMCDDHRDSFWTAAF